MGRGGGRPRAALAYGTDVSSAAERHWFCERRDHPDLGLSATINVGPDPDLDALVGLVALRDLMIARWIIEGAFRAHLSARRGLSYSRSEEWHVRARRGGWPTTSKHMIKIVAHLEARNIVENHVAAPSPPSLGAGLQSWLRLTPPFLDWLLRRGGVLGKRLHPMRDLVRLKDRHSGHPLPLPSSRFVRELERTMLAINEVVAAANWEPAAGHIKERHGHLALVQGARGETWLNLGAHGFALLLSQTGSLRGWSFGRMHGWGMQSSPKDVRRGGQIGSQDVDEADFMNMHPRLALWESGLPCASPSDLYAPIYEASREPRRLVKIAVSVGLNAKTKRGAAWAVAGEVAAMDGRSVASRSDLYRATALMCWIQKLCPALFDKVGTDAGVRYMRIESEILRFAARDLMSDGTLFVPLHDAFVIPRGRASRAREAMARASFSILRHELPTRQLLTV